MNLFSISAFRWWASVFDTTTPCLPNRWLVALLVDWKVILIRSQSLKHFPNRHRNTGFWLFRGFSQMPQMSRMERDLCDFLRISASNSLGYFLLTYMFWSPVTIFYDALPHLHHSPAVLTFLQHRNSCWENLGKQFNDTGYWGFPFTAWTCKIHDICMSSPVRTNLQSRGGCSTI